MLVMGIGKGVCQIMGQLAQSVILPDAPFGTPLQIPDAAVDVELGADKVMSLRLMGKSDPSQKGERIAVRLKGAELESQFIAAGGKSAAAAEQGIGQLFVAAFLLRNSLRK